MHGPPAKIHHPPSIANINSPLSILNLLELKHIIIMSSFTTSEEILVLYGSSTGNSEGAAEQITAAIPTKLTSNSKPCTARLMTLDDFLENEHAKWTRLVVIVCSSYGVGQAPLGARKFRDVCDAILEKEDDNDNNNRKSNKFLEGVTFALLGLGDSHYTTFFQNPSTIHKALTTAGAVRVGELGKADASGTGIDEQSKVIDRWIAAIWDDLNKVVSVSTTTTTKSPQEEEVLGVATAETWKICMELFPEWKPKSGLVGLVTSVLGVFVGGVVFAVGVNYYLDRDRLDQKF